MEAKQKKYRFNIIDVLIILVVLAIGVVMYYYMGRNEFYEKSIFYDITIFNNVFHK